MSKEIPLPPQYKHPDPIKISDLRLNVSLYQGLIKDLEDKLWRYELSCDSTYHGFKHRLGEINSQLELETQKPYLPAQELLVEYCCTKCNSFECIHVKQFYYLSNIKSNIITFRQNVKEVLTEKFQLRKKEKKFNALTYLLSD